MALAENIMAVAPGSAEAERIRSLAVAGDAQAMKQYVYWTFWQNLQREKPLPVRHARAIFRRIVGTIDVKVGLDV